jgi:hypothetical protein
VSIWFCSLHASYGSVSYQAFLLEGSLYMFDECRSQVQSYMFLVKYCCRINIGIDDYLVEDLCV